MYRSDHHALYQRAQSLERELEQAKASRTRDATHIATLEQELWKARQWLQAAGVQAAMPQQLPPSRATTALVLGILSLVACSILGPFAWNIGHQEVQKMDAGLVDPSDRGSAVAGKVCGIIGTAVLGLFVLICVASMLLVTL